VRPTKSDSIRQILVPSRITVAAGPMDSPVSSNIPARISRKRRLPAGTGDCSVSITCVLSLIFFGCIFINIVTLYRVGQRSQVAEICYFEARLEVW
jgi:hypothetical protein